jgi:hypothetical protein
MDNLSEITFDFIVLKSLFCFDGKCRGQEV